MTVAAEPTPDIAGQTDLLWDSTSVSTLDGVQEYFATKHSTARNDHDAAAATNLE